LTHCRATREDAAVRILAAAALALALVSTAAAALRADALTLVPDKLPDGVVGKHYSVTIKPAGGVEPALVSCEGYGGGFGFDKLPKGLEQKLPNPGQPSSPSLTVVGTPQEAGSFRLDICAADKESRGLRKIYEFKVTGEEAKPEADLRVTVASERVDATYVRFVVTIANSGPATARAVVHRGSLPHLDAVSSTRGSCSDTAAAFTCSIGDLPKGASARVTIVGRHPERSSYTLLSSVKTPTVDPRPWNNLANGSWEAERESDLSLTLSGPANTSGDLNWVARVANKGPDDASVAVRFFVDGDIDVKKAFPEQQCGRSGATVVTCGHWLKAGKRFAFTVRGERALASSAKAVTVSARIENERGDAKDPVPRDNRDSVTTKLG
jgi:hypothetical protein